MVSVEPAAYVGVEYRSPAMRVSDRAMSDFFMEFVESLAQRQKFA